MILTLHRTITEHRLPDASYRLPTMVEPVQIDTGNIARVLSSAGTTASVIDLKDGGSVQVIEHHQLIEAAVAWNVPE